MIVRELKKELEKYDDNTEVLMDCNNEYIGNTVDKVELDKHGKLHIIEDVWAHEYDNHYL